MAPDDLRSVFADGSANWNTAALRPPADLATAASTTDLTLFEPRMMDRRGHFALLADHYLALAESLGLSSTVFHHQGWSGERSRAWHGLFPIPDHFIGAGVNVDLQILERYTRYFENALATALRQTTPRVAVFPTARFLTLPAIAKAVCAAPSLRGVIIGAMETWPVPDCENQELVEAAFSRAAATLLAGKTPVQIFAESDAIAEDLRALGFSGAGENSLSIQVAPYPAAARLAERKPDREDASLPRFLALGASRPVHNPGVLAQFLLEAELPRGHWSVRLNTPLAADQLGVAADALNARLASRGIDLIPGHLTQTAYDRALIDADLMLLPYGERYETIGSGIFLECLCAGVIPLVPAGSTMRSLYESLGGMAPAIPAATPAGIAEAVSRSTKRMAELQDNALLVRDRWLDHPHGPRRWVDRVSRLLRY